MSTRTYWWDTLLLKPNEPVVAFGGASPLLPEEPILLEVIGLRAVDMSFWVKSGFPPPPLPHAEQMQLFDHSVIDLVDIDIDPFPILCRTLFQNSLAGHQLPAPVQITNRTHRVRVTSSLDFPIHARVDLGVRLL